MRPRRNFSLLLPAFLCLASLTSARLLAEEARAGAAARYVVFEIDADGAVRPQMHRIVELSSAWRSLTPEEVASRLARPARDVEQVHVRMFADGGALAFEDVVAVPRWTRAELPVSEDAPDADIERRTSAERKARVRGPRARARQELAGPLGRPRRPTSARRRLPRRGVRPRRARLGRQPAAGPLCAGGGASVRGGRELGQSRRRPRHGRRLYVRRARQVRHGRGQPGLEFFSITPYSTYRNFVNTATLFTTSTQSGADHPPFSASCASTPFPSCCADPTAQTDTRAGTFVTTAFDATFCSSNIHRLLVVDNAKVLAAAAASPDWTQIFVIVNDTTYGGSGGTLIATLSTNPTALSIAQHEYGHSFTELTDEYSDVLPGFSRLQRRDLAGVRAQRHRPAGSRLDQVERLDRRGHAGAHARDRAVQLGRRPLRGRPIPLDRHVPAPPELPDARARPAVLRDSAGRNTCSSSIAEAGASRPAASI